MVTVIVMKQFGVGFFDGKEEADSSPGDSLSLNGVEKQIREER